MTLPLGVDGLAAAYLDRSTTPEAEVERILGAIDQLDPTLGAWQVVYVDEARAAARGWGRVGRLLQVLSLIHI